SRDGQLRVAAEGGGRRADVPAPAPPRVGGAGGGGAVRPRAVPVGSGRDPGRGAGAGRPGPRAAGGVLTRPGGDTGGMATENSARLAVLIDADNAQPSIT